jgi:hypothetical protein
VSFLYALVLISTQATQDPFYLDVGERVLLDLIRRAKVECGLSTLSNVQTGEHEDRMESFALSETLKVSEAFAPLPSAS